MSLKFWGWGKPGSICQHAMFWVSSAAEGCVSSFTLSHSRWSASSLEPNTHLCSWREISFHSEAVILIHFCVSSLGNSPYRLMTHPMWFVTSYSGILILLNTGSHQLTSDSQWSLGESASATWLTSSDRFTSGQPVLISFVLLITRSGWAPLCWLVGLCNILRGVWIPVCMRWTGQFSCLIDSRNRL